MIKCQITDQVRRDYYTISFWDTEKALGED
jgi:hypothetical protein